MVILKNTRLNKCLYMVFYTTCRRPLHSRTVFKNFKNHSRRFKTIFRNFRNQSAFYNHHASQMSIKQFEILFKTECTIFKNQKTCDLSKWTKSNLKVL